MSELKTYLAYKVDDFPIWREFYLKSEADKVIAEKDKEIENLEKYIKELQNATDSAWSKVNAMYDELRHHKYKRCLAMAKVCYLRFIRYENYLQKLCASNATIAAYKFRRDMYDKWENRWLELAARKEAKDDDSVSFIEADLKLLTDRKTLLTNRIKDLLDKT